MSVIHLVCLPQWQSDVSLYHTYWLNIPVLLPDHFQCHILEFVCLSLNGWLFVPFGGPVSVVVCESSVYELLRWHGMGLHYIALLCWSKAPHDTPSATNPILHAPSIVFFYCNVCPSVCQRCRYEVNQGHPGIYTDGLIFCASVPIFRGEDNRLLSEPVCASFVTIPAPNRTAPGSFARSQCGRTLCAALFCCRCRCCCCCCCICCAAAAAAAAAAAVAVVALRTVGAKTKCYLWYIYLSGMSCTCTTAILSVPSNLKVNPSFVLHLVVPFLTGNCRGIKAK